jgi:hypothetical protein
METSEIIPATSAADFQALNTSVQVHSCAGLGLGGFFGGPLAITYLIYRDLASLGRTDLLSKVAIWFVPLIVFWLYCLFSFPPDLISQWTLYLPQTILWWIVARHLLADIHRVYRAAGGSFYSRWHAVRFGFFVFLGLKLIFFVTGALI